MCTQLFAFLTEPDRFNVLGCAFVSAMAMSNNAYGNSLASTNESCIVQTFAENSRGLKCIVSYKHGLIPRLG